MGCTSSINVSYSRIRPCVALERALNGTNPDDAPDIRYKTSEATIQEDEEPLTPNPGQNRWERANTGDDQVVA